MTHQILKNPYIPAKKCKCIDSVIQCDGCQFWLHYECAGLTADELRALGSNAIRDFFCSRCELLELPFYLMRGSFISDNNESCMITGGCPEAISPVEGTLGEYNSTTMSENTNCSRNVPKTSNRSVYFDQFLEINCSYLNPNNLDDYFFCRKENSVICCLS